MHTGRAPYCVEKLLLFWYYIGVNVTTIAIAYTNRFLVVCFRNRIVSMSEIAIVGDMFVYVVVIFPYVCMHTYSILFFRQIASE